MDAKNSKDSGLISEDNYYSLKNMLNGTDEDFEVATSNLQNLYNTISEEEKADFACLLLLLYKDLRFNKRYHYTESFKDHPILKGLRFGSEDITWKAIYNKLTVTKVSPLIKKIFHDSIQKDIANEYTKHFTFIKDVNIELKW
jgi:hypothetical protein